MVRANVGMIHLFSHGHPKHAGPSPSKDIIHRNATSRLEKGRYLVQHEVRTETRFFRE